MQHFCDNQACRLHAYHENGSMKFFDGATGLTFEVNRHCYTDRREQIKEFYLCDTCHSAAQMVLGEREIEA